MSYIVRGYRDQIRRASGSVVVSSVGEVTSNSATLGVFSIAGTARMTYDTVYFQPNANRGMHLGGASNYWDTCYLHTVTGGAGGISTTGVVTSTGTSPSTFSGPVKVSGTAATIANSFSTDATGGGGYNVLTMRQVGAISSVIGLQTNGDAAFFAATGVAGSEAYTESFRIVNASGMVKFSQNVGIGQSPDSGYIVAAYSTSTTQTVARFLQGATSATAPVVVVKLGATPGSGGDALQVQNSAGTAMLQVTGETGSQRLQLTNATYGIHYNGYIAGSRLSVTADGASVIPAILRGAASQAGDLFQTQDSSGAYQSYIDANGIFGYKAGHTQTTVGAAGAASALPANPTGYFKFNVAGTVYAVPYYAAA
jgi:hypothetical protein